MAAIASSGVLATLARKGAESFLVSSSREAQETSNAAVAASGKIETNFFMGWKIVGRAVDRGKRQYDARGPCSGKEEASSPRSASLGEGSR